MKVPVSWLRDYVDLPDELTTEALAARLTAFDLKLEEIVSSGISGPLVVGRVLCLVKEEQKNGKTINWCRVDVGAHNDPSVPDAPGDDVPSRGIICGAHNFVEGDLVVVSLPGTVLPALANFIPGGEISARKTYGHVSDGMICSSAELDLPGDASGIIVLEPGSAQPGDDAIALLGLGEEVLDLEVNPDRAYALSLRGVARDAAIAFGVSFHDPADVQSPPAGDGWPVRVDDPAAAPVFVALEVTGFDPTRPSPAWMAQRLEQCGMRSISLAVDISNYVMLELGQPNHAYDRAKLQGDIVVRRATVGEKITTLDDVVRELDVDDLVITDDRGPVGIAGVMGAASVEIDDSTTDIVIESAYFDPATIFRSARRHRIGSEASKRNERGIDSTLQARAASRVAELMVELGGGAVAEVMTVVGESPAMASIELSTSLPARITGVDIDTVTAVEALEANGCTVEVDHEWLTVTPPPWRPDLTDPYDIVEDVLRVVGYDQVPSVIPVAPAGRGLTVAQKLRRRVGTVLAGEGLVEVKTFPFAGPADWDRMGLDADDIRRRQVLLENPLSAEDPGMTTTLLSGLLRSLVLNIGRGHADVHITETGRVFLPRPGAAEAPIYGVARRPTADELAALTSALPDQPFHVGLVMSGERVRSGWAGPGRAATWADAVAVVQHLAASLHVEVTVEAASLAPWHPGRCAAVLVDGEVVGHAGELHPRVLKAYGLPPRVVAAEIDLDALIAASPAIGPRPEFSSYPVAKEDLALVVDASVAAGPLGQALAAASPLIESARLFDAYTGDQVPEGKKSLAYALRLRAPDRTLTDDDIRGAREAAVSAANRAAGATLRT
ncbi:phenylalanine--tRNA ligase subunit beta [Aeromicrobium fastidiosum]|uniref:Phenylalanine--tRNA ligase beta subunit n=1 Tax=Aeromicrobium fastidiosum TaxID=52699 RepID=A0A641AK26_9ACTN|nr:phenylalanine--tRNA ligase subunit beta [Aeromicrobium fastidiosum]KAA1376201.1 phenylalanine--tRNA ligase subunit beta [Aeromicrobium fastidiosum]MBP2391911.1 phenylalanyl-tRNA synthetase beta chain [Aeromicrobium fastidiosum]